MKIAFITMFPGNPGVFSKNIFVCRKQKNFYKSFKKAKKNRENREKPGKFLNFYMMSVKNCKKCQKNPGVLVKMRSKWIF